ncbi:hypothetical protein PABG_11810 [Paracoccidioides brasiliensis Pb03]|uniref:Uncharacterized protein n=1 Tax=Paracoccidioides brasiliensis TaxID=121759 RepID=A0A1D2JG39_PARBR|nr:hypothetical protein PABG_11810 [Paracoccidioides brasiliensis Pb03]ODH32678.1 hypothetical protein ACO22_03372 [Paracoccidioides brasiliensis]ODH51874.1 hypothetical protein GX48_01883 [Paracoccidioides brasiliensis]
MLGELSPPRTPLKLGTPINWGPARDFGFPSLASNHHLCGDLSQILKEDDNHMIATDLDMLERGLTEIALTHRKKAST